MHEYEEKKTSFRYFSHFTLHSLFCSVWNSILFNSTQEKNIHNKENDSNVIIAIKRNVFQKSRRRRRMGLWRKRIPFYCFIFKSFLWLPLFFFFLLLHGLHSFFLLLLRFRFNNNNKSLSLSAFRATSFLFLSLSALTAEQFLLFKLLEKCAKWYNRHFTLYMQTRPYMISSKLKQSRNCIYIHCTFTFLSLSLSNDIT